MPDPDPPQQEWDGGMDIQDNNGNDTSPSRRSAPHTNMEERYACKPGIVSIVDQKKIIDASYGGIKANDSLFLDKLHVKKSFLRAGLVVSLSVL